MAADCLLALISCQCRGIKFYDLSDIGARQGDGFILVREPHNPRDSNCIAVFLRGSATRDLRILRGHNIPANAYKPSNNHYNVQNLKSFTHPVMQKGPKSIGESQSATFLATWPSIGIAVGDIGC